MASLIRSPHLMQGISVAVGKRVQVGVGKVICGIVSSDFKEETQRYPLEPKFHFTFVMLCSILSDSEA